MAEYAVGDIQGCMEALQCVLERVHFTPGVDRLWVTGDLVNRGPQSLEVLRFVKGLGDSAIVVLGNHDLHLIALAYGDAKPKRKDTLQCILDAADRDELMAWLRHQSLAHYDHDRNILMTHAGIPHIWTLSQALKRAREIEVILRGKSFQKFLLKMYGNSPTRWNSELKGDARLRVITNYFTRMRFIDKKGNLELVSNSEPESAPKGFAPWFSFPRQDDMRVVFGHWAALMGNTGSERFIGLDTGCIWGGELTLMNIDSGERVSCRCQSAASTDATASL